MLWLNSLKKICVNPDPVKIIDMPEFVQSKLQPYVEDRLKTLCNF